MVNYFTPKANKKFLNQIVEVTVESLDMNGYGVAKVAKKPLFIDGALPGELAKVKIIEEKSKYLRGASKSITQPSSMRTEPKCKHYYQCGGCDIQHLNATAQIDFKQQKISDLYRRNCQLTQLPWQDALTGFSWNYRRKARVGVQYNKLDQAIIGFRKKNSNVLTEIKNCQVLPEVFYQQFQNWQLFIEQLQSKRAISHIELIDAVKPLAIFRVIRKLAKVDVDNFVKFAKQQDYKVALQYDDNIQYLNGASDAQLQYQVLGCDIQFNTTDFVQVNASLNEPMVEQAISWLELNNADIVLDLFCGLGNFSLPMAKLANKVIGVEGVQVMVDKAIANASLNNLDNCQFLQADINAEGKQWSWLDSNTKVNKVLLDPARAGALNAMSKIVKLKPTKILYVSCDVATMSRDAKVLLENGYHLEKISLMDMFAQTHHVETMALFVRKNAK